MAVPSRLLGIFANRSRLIGSVASINAQLVGSVNDSGGSNTQNIAVSLTGSTPVPVVVAVHGQFGGTLAFTADGIDGTAVEQLLYYKDGSFETVLIGKGILTNATTCTVKLDSPGTNFRVCMTVYECDNYPASPTVDTYTAADEAAGAIDSYNGGAIIGIGGSQNAQATALGIQGLATEDVAPEIVSSAFWWCAASENSVGVAGNTVHLDADGETGRLIFGAVSISP